MPAHVLRGQGGQPVPHADLQEVLARFPMLEMALVFGSVAQGRARMDSDLDIAVSAGQRVLTLDERRALIEALAERTGRPVDLIDLQVVGEPLLGQILRHGQRLLGSDGAYAHLLSRHLFEQADFMPYRTRLLAERRTAWIGRQVVEQKLESLRRCLLRISSKCPDQPEVLAADPDLQDIISLNLSRAVQLCVDIGAHLVAGLNVPPPDTMGQTFDVLAQAGLLDAGLAHNLKKAVGFRNIAVHDYQAINWHIVHSIVKNHLGDFTEMAKVVAGKMSDA